MIAKFVVFVTLAIAVNGSAIPFGAPAALVAPAVAPAVPVAPAVAAAYAVAPYASSYSAHTVNHAVAEPVFAPAPVVAPARLVAPAAPLVAAPAAPVVSARYFTSPYYF